MSGPGLFVERRRRGSFRCFIKNALLPGPGRCSSNANAKKIPAGNSRCYRCIPERRLRRRGVVDGARINPLVKLVSKNDEQTLAQSVKLVNVTI